MLAGVSVGSEVNSGSGVAGATVGSGVGVASSSVGLAAAAAVGGAVTAGSLVGIGVLASGVAVGFASQVMLEVADGASVAGANNGRGVEELTAVTAAEARGSGCSTAVGEAGVRGLGAGVAIGTRVRVGATGAVGRRALEIRVAIGVAPMAVDGTWPGGVASAGGPATAVGGAGAIRGTSAGMLVGGTTVIERTGAGGRVAVRTAWDAVRDGVAPGVTAGT
ncbi:MAG TPA: hypothetical protein VM536_04385 [Chloroflexia bacterium]|nr:hypothetical protein [Chloroflexia bacterium]